MAQHQGLGRLGEPARQGLAIAWIVRQGGLMPRFALFRAGHGG
jgi:hypothetical protein